MKLPTNVSRVQNAQQILKNVFGFDHFRSTQRDIIESVLEQRNTLAIMPTGGGKSLCYQIPAMVFDGLTIVISPLISLMQDQVRQLVELDIAAVVLNSSLSPDEYQDNLAGLKNGQFSLLFLAPETALQPSILKLLQSINVPCIAIDEAHCISEWGHEFRPEYRQLDRLVSCFPDAVTIALTATATPRVREDIKRQLNINDDSEFIASFDRPNLYLEVAPKESAYQQTKDFIEKHTTQSGIVYCQSRASVDELTAKLNQDGFSVLPYHAGLNNQKRAANQEKFVRDDVDIIVATIAFGMGINKPDVRYVVHYDLPKNIESYYQQIGRAGRDGQDADCLLLFGYGDTGKIRFFIDQMNNEHEKRLATMHLNQMLALAETEDCRRIPLLQYFGEPEVSETCVKCDNCLTDDKFLSCVHRTGQRFGAGHIIDVLRGSNAEKVIQNQHNLLSTYDIGNELNKKQWMTLSRQLIQKKLLQQEEQFGGLKLTELAADVLKGKVPFYAMLQQATPEKRQTGSKSDVVGNTKLVTLLKTERKKSADQANVPPYAIFSDRSLQEMAYYLPHSEQSMLKIHGVGSAKLLKYAALFLSIIVDFCVQHDLQELPNKQIAGAQVKKEMSKSTSVGNKTKEVVEQFENGSSVADLSRLLKVKDNTIYNHLYKYAQLGNKLTKPERLVDEAQLTAEQVQAGIAAFEAHGSERLKPVYEALGEDINYEQLHLLRAFYLH
jgi:ATP-dependent DNA helicase RecQ